MLARQQSHKKDQTISNSQGTKQEKDSSPEFVNKESKPSHSMPDKNEHSKSDSPKAIPLKRPNSDDDTVSQ